MKTVLENIVRNGVRFKVTRDAKGTVGIESDCECLGLGSWYHSNPTCPNKREDDLPSFPAPFTSIVKPID